MTAKVEQTAYAENHTPPVIGSRIVRVALSLMGGAFLATGLQVGKLSILAYNNDTDAVYILSQTQPFFLLAIAIIEGLAIGNQVFCAKSLSDWQSADVIRSTKYYSIISLIFIVLMSSILYLIHVTLKSDYTFAETIAPQCALFLISMVPYAFLELKSAALRGRGHATGALGFLCLTIIIDFCITLLCAVHFRMGFHAVIVGNIIGPLISLPLISVALRRKLPRLARGPDPEFKARLLGLLIGVSVPVFFSIVAGFLSSAIIFPRLSEYGAAVASAFLITIRLRAFFVIPAVAASSAIAIVTNQQPEEQRLHKRQIILKGFLGTIAVYLLITIVMLLIGKMLFTYLQDRNTVELNQEIITITIALFPTFFMAAASVFLQGLLEQLGKGIFALSSTIATECILFILVLVAADGPAGLTFILLALNGVAAANLAFLAIGFAWLLYQLGGKRAV